MISLVRNKRFFLFLGVFIVGTVFGVALVAKFNLTPGINAETDKSPSTTLKTNEADLRSAFVKVAESVGPAVVSISAERVQKIPGVRRYYNNSPRGGSPFGDDFFDEFFKDFFGQQAPQREYKQVGLGSGVIIDEEGYILTNEHVVSGAKKIRVTLSDGRTLNAEIKGTDPRSDLAIIKINSKKLPFAELGNSDLAQTGEWVVAIGNPFGFALNNPEPTVTVGVISAIHRSLPGPSRRGTDKALMDLIQTDAAINPGNSGGPLCDLNGDVIGINVAIVSTSGGYQGIGFAIPSNIANGIIGDLIKGKRIAYGWFGVSVQEITDDLAEFFGLPEGEGVLVADIMKDGPAFKAGMKAGDMIMKINGQKIGSVRDVLRIVGKMKPGEKTAVALIRDKKNVNLTVVTGERPGETTQVAEKDEVETKEEVVWRGAKVIDISPELAEKYSIDDTDGVLIAGIDPSSPVAQAGLRRGDIIREINKRAIRNKSDFNKLVKSARGNVLIRTEKGYVIVRESEE